MVVETGGKLVGQEDLVAIELFWGAKVSCSLLIIYVNLFVQWTTTLEPLSHTG